MNARFQKLSPEEKERLRKTALTYTPDQKEFVSGVIAGWKATAAASA